MNCPPSMKVQDRDGKFEIKSDKEYVYTCIYTYKVGKSEKPERGKGSVYWTLSKIMP